MSQHHGHRHPHAHNPSGHHHDHHDADVPDHEPPAIPSPERPAPHDSDAIYLASLDAIAGDRSLIEIDFESFSLSESPDDGFVWTTRDQSSLPADRWHPPPSSCPLYLQHLTLLI
jgi:hypothetical protein